MDNQQIYAQPKIISPPEVVNPKIEQAESQPIQHVVEKPKKEPAPEANDNSEDDSEENNEEEQNDKEKNDTPKEKQKESKKKHSNNTKKKHLKPETEESESEKAKNAALHEQTIMGKQFEDDVHDGAAERPPGAILLLTLGSYNYMIRTLDV